MKPFRIHLLVALVAAAAVLSSCDDKEKKLQEQVDALTAEIESIDTQRKTAEADLDSIIKEKETIAEEAFAAKQFGEEQRAKLTAANSALFAARKKNEDLQRQLDQWKARADSLAAENAQLKAKIAELNQRVAAAEQRAIDAENRAAAAEAKVLELQAKVANTYFVAAVEVVGTNSKGETYPKDKIKPGTDILNFNITVGRPAGQAAAPLNLTLTVMDSKGKWHEGTFTTAADKGVFTVNVTELKLDLDPGRYNFEVKEGGNKLYSGFFTCSR